MGWGSELYMLEDALDASAEGLRREYSRSILQMLETLDTATGSVPVTPVVKGSPVILVATPEAGVPRRGVTKVVLVIALTTLAPEPAPSV